MAVVPRLAVLTLALFATGCASLEGGSPARNVTLESRSGSSVTGTLRLRDGAAGLRIQGEVRGLQPNTEHGFHIHEKGDCSAADATSAGPHFNPAGAPRRPRGQRRAPRRRHAEHQGGCQWRGQGRPRWSPA